jgi:hypothetical protein
MTDRDFHDRLHDLGHVWQASIAPVQDPAEVAAREQRHVRAIGDAIVRASETRRRDRSRRRIYAVLAAAVALGVAFVAARAVFREPTVAPSVKVFPAAPHRGVRSLAGQVTLHHGSSEHVIHEASLAMGDELSVSAGGQAEVRLGGVVRANAQAGSHVTVVAEGSKSAHRLRLETGHIEARVDDRPSPKPKLVVETPDVDVVVTGTVFGVDVARGPHGATVTKVSVDKGRVVIVRGGVEIALVTSGSTWSSEVAEETAPAVVAPVAPRASRPLPRPSSAEPVAKLPSAANLADVPIGTLGEENAAFQAAIDARNRGDDGAVVDRLGQLMIRYPSSPLAGEARVERMRALARLGRTEAAAREARRYLATHPDGFARDEAKRLVLKSAAAPSNSPAP